MTDVKSIKVTKSRTNSNMRQRPSDYSRPLKVINAKVEQTDGEFPDNVFKPHEAVRESPRNRMQQ